MVVEQYGRQAALMLGVRVATGDEYGTAVHPHVWQRRGHATEQERNRRHANATDVE